MEEKRKSLLQWIREHKKELIIAGVSIAAIIGIVLVLKNTKEISQVLKELKSLLNKPDRVAKEMKNRVHLSDVKKVTELAEPTITLNCTSNELKAVIPFKVRNHVRNLHSGWHASPEKIIKAKEYGYNLKPGQTWVDSYTKASMVA